jgi:hypothetical protein
MFSINGPERSKIVPSFAQTQRVIGTTPYFVGIVIVLAVIFPEANRTDLVLTAPVESLKSTTWASERGEWLKGLGDVAKWVAHEASRSPSSRDPKLKFTSDRFPQAKLQVARGISTTYRRAYAHIGVNE